jgi:hypothetical protein
MAQKIITLYTDDVTGEENTEVATHHFALDGVAYEIDLGPDSYDKLLEALAPFMRAGRKTGRVKAVTAPQRRKASNGESTARIREWAKENGYEVNARGRVPANVRLAYEAAH